MTSTSDAPTFGSAARGRRALTSRASRALAWGAAVVLPVVAAFATLALGASMERNIFLLFAVAIVAAAMLGGVAPGLVATAISAVAADVLLLSPTGTVVPRTTADDVRLGTFLVVMIGVCVLCDAFLRTLRRLREREAALARSEADLRMLLRNASDAIVIADARGRVLDANAMASTLSGFTHDELVGRPARDVLVDRGRRRGAPVDRDSAAAGSATCRLRRKDGRMLDVEVSATRFADGRILAIARDVTERRRLETERRQAQRLEALGQLAGGVAHDFNNIVAVIRASAELLRATLPDDGEPREDADEIVLACDRATALTRQLLLFSRRRQLMPALVEPDVVAREMARMLSLGIGPATLRLALAAPGAAILVDPGQLEQVLMHLAVNARDAMPQGGTVTVASAIERGATPDAARLVLTIADTGAGMDAPTLALAFEPFFTTKEAGRGTGLGLATVREIVERAEGTIGVTSEPGRGTTFRLVFPVAAETPVVAAPPTPLPWRGERDRDLAVA